MYSANRLRRSVVSVVAGLLLAVGVAGSALAAPNPNGTGQPSQSCQAQPSGPAGFNSGGFAHAETVYAGSPGTPSAANGNAHAVSQYDVACYQVSNKR